MVSQMDNQFSRPREFQRSGIESYSYSGAAGTRTRNEAGHPPRYFDPKLTHRQQCARYWLRGQSSTSTAALSTSTKNSRAQRKEIAGMARSIPDGTMVTSANDRGISGSVSAAKNATSLQPESDLVAEPTSVRLRFVAVRAVPVATRSTDPVVATATLAAVHDVSEQACTAAGDRADHLAMPHRDTVPKLLQVCRCVLPKAVRNSRHGLPRRPHKPLN